MALGAGRRRLLQPHLIEHVVIALCGGLAAIGVGYAMLRWIQAVIPPYSLPPAVDIRMDVGVLLFTLIVAVVTGPVRHRAGVALDVAPPGRSADGRTARHDHCGAGTARARCARRRRDRAGVRAPCGVGTPDSQLLKLLEIDPGFDVANAMTAELPLAPAQHPDPVALNSYLLAIRDAVEAVPGVRETASHRSCRSRAGGCNCD